MGVVRAVSLLGLTAVALVLLLLLQLSASEAAVSPLRKLKAPERVLQPDHAKEESTESRALVSTHSEAHAAAGARTVVSTAYLTNAYNNVNNAQPHIDQLRKVIATYWTAYLACGADGVCKANLSRQWNQAYYNGQITAVTHVSSRTVPHATWAGKLFTYSLDARGRVTAALGYVGGVNPSTDPTSAAAEYCEVLEVLFPANYNKYTGTHAWSAQLTPLQKQDSTMMWSRGHIVGASLGGSNTDPLNFFPQRQYDNGSGRWKAGEDVATMFLADLKDGIAAINQCVHVQMTFDYPGNDVIPSGGDYTVTVKPLCLKKEAWTSWGGVANVHHADTTIVIWNTRWSQDETPNNVVPPTKPVRGA